MGLVLSRRVGEEIIVGDDVKVTVVKIGLVKVKLLISTPGEAAIHRGEIYRAIARERAAGRHAHCPFCGSTRLSAEAGREAFTAAVLCKDCGGTGPPAADERGAWLAWDARAAARCRAPRRGGVA